MFIRNNDLNRSISTLIRGKLDSLFYITTNSDYTEALFNPNKWIITLPFAAIQLCNLNRKRAAYEYSGIKFQIGYENKIILHRFSYPTPAKKIHIKVIDLTEIKDIPTHLLTRYREIFRLKG